MARHAHARRLRPDALVLACLGLWLLTRAATHVVTASGSWLLSPAGAPSTVRGFSERWSRWDVDLFRKVAEHGYQGYPSRYPDVGIEAFFPGFPVVLRLVHLVVPDWTVAGMVVSAVAGGVAVVGLARLAALDGAPGQRAVLYLVVSPFAVFLAAAYSESLFLAFAVWGWHAARRGRWAAAGVLVALSCTVRISGLFLALALVVEWCVQRRRDPSGAPLRSAAWLLLPFGALAGYSAYLYVLTGDPLRWLSAQEEGWGRRLTLPGDALLRTLRFAADPRIRADFAWTYVAEVVAVAVGVLGALLLLRARRWGEAAYVGLSVSALATSTYYLSVDRATVLWFPLFVLLAQAGARREAVHVAYLVLSAPMSVLVALAFTTGRWTG